MRAKNVGKKSSKKVQKHVFYIHTNIVTKKCGKKARNNFSRKKRIVPAKKFGKNIVSKKYENTFFIFTRILRPKSGGKMPETIFPETHE